MLTNEMKKSYLPKVSLVIPIFNGIDNTAAFLKSLSVVTYSNHEVIIVDDGSTDGSSEFIARQFPDVRLLKGDGSLWWAGGTNLGVEDALERGADFILTINNDNEVTPNFLTSLVETALQNQDCIIKSVGYDSENKDVLRFFGGEIRWWHGSIDQLMQNIELGVKTVEVPLANGNSTLIPAKVFRDIGLYDAEHCPQYHADSELLLRARKHGYRVLVDNGSIIYNNINSCAGQSAYENMSYMNLLRDRRSAYYFKANYKIYKEYCPYRFFLFFLLLRYVFLFKDLFIRNIAGRLNASIL